MESWQRELISRNIDKLIDITEYNEQLVAILMAKGVISNADKSGLVALKYEGPHSQISKLYDILQGRVGGFEALVYALYETQQTGAGKLLVSNYERDNREQLRAAVEQGDYNKVTSLFRSNKSLSSLKVALIMEGCLLHACVKNSNADSPAVVENKKQIIQFLIQICSAESQANILDQKDETQRAPLLQPNASLELLKCLVDAYAFVNTKDVGDNNILHLAPLADGMTPDEFHLMTEYFANSGLTLNSINKKGETPLHVAIKNLDVHPKTVVIFHNRSPQLFKIKDNNGNGLIHLLVSDKTRSSKLIPTLMSNGAVWNERNQNGETALDVAIEEGNVRGISVLACDWAYRSAGMYHEAIKICEREYENLISGEGIDPLAPQALLEAKASILLKLRRKTNFTEALEIYTKIYETRREILGDKDESTLAALNGKGEALSALGRFDDAILAFTEVYEKRASLLGENDPDTLTTRNEIAVVLSGQGNFGQATTVFEQVLEKRRKHLGEDHLDTVTTRYDMAKQLMSEKKYDGTYGAIHLLEKVVETRRISLGEDHDLTLLTQLDIMECYARLERWSEALKVLEEVRRVGGERAKAWVPDGTLRLMRGGLAIREMQNAFLGLFGFGK